MLTLSTLVDFVRRPLTKLVAILLGQFRFGHHLYPCAGVRTGIRGINPMIWRSMLCNCFIVRLIKHFQADIRTGNLDIQSINFNIYHLSRNLRRIKQLEVRCAQTSDIHQFLVLSFGQCCFVFLKCKDLNYFSPNNFLTWQYEEDMARLYILWLLSTQKSGLRF